jgi:hypothetical protein
VTAGSAPASVLVPMAFVRGVAVTVVHEVHMVLVWHRHVAAVGSVLVVVAVVLDVGGGITFVGMLTVHAVQVPVMDVVDVVLVRYGHVPASRPVRVVVVAVLTMLDRSGHDSPSANRYDAVYVFHRKMVHAPNRTAQALAVSRANLHESLGDSSGCRCDRR